MNMKTFKIRIISDNCEFKIQEVTKKFYKLNERLIIFKSEWDKWSITDYKTGTKIFGGYQHTKKGTIQDFYQWVSDNFGSYSAFDTELNTRLAYRNLDTINFS